MKQIVIFYMLLLIFAFAISTTFAKSANANFNELIINNKEKYTDSAAANNNEENAANLEVYPNPTDGMLTVKTESAGKIYFYSKKGKEKGECLVSEGTSMIALQNLLFPGTYTCRFEGLDGSVAEVSVDYKR